MQRIGLVQLADININDVQSIIFRIITKFCNLKFSFVIVVSPVFTEFYSLITKICSKN